MTPSANHSIRTRDPRLEAADQAEMPGTCSHPGCRRPTSGGKPVCIEHLASLPNVQRILHELSDRQTPPHDGRRATILAARRAARRSLRAAG